MSGKDLIFLVFIQFRRRNYEIFTKVLSHVKCAWSRLQKRLPHPKFYNLSTVCSYANMRTFKNSVLMSKKGTYQADSVSQFVSFAAHSRLKIFLPQ